MKTCDQLSNLYDKISLDVLMVSWQIAGNLNKNIEPVSILDFDFGFIV